MIFEENWQEMLYNYYMKQNKPLYEHGYHDKEHHLNNLQVFYNGKRQKYTENFNKLLEENNLDRKIFDKEQEIVDGYKANWEKSDTPELKELKRKIEIFEGIVADQIDGGNWMGEGVEAVPTHEIDDILRGVDNVLEFSPLDEEGQEKDDVPKEYLGLGFDLLVHKDEARLNKKMERFTQEDILKGKLGKVKYFDGSEISGRLDVFRAVIASNGKTMEDLINLRIKKDWEALSNHPFQADMFFQLSLQIQAAIQYAVKVNNHNYIDKLRGVAEKINTIYEKRAEFLESQAERVSKTGDYRTMAYFLRKNLDIDI